MAVSIAGWADDSLPLSMVGDTRARLVSRVYSLKRDYDKSWRQLHTNVANFVQPWLGQAVWSEPNLALRGEYMVDLHPMNCSLTAANGMSAGMSSPARPWFQFAVRDPRAQKQDVVKQYLADAAGAVRQAFAMSNFYNSLGQMYRYLNSFGTGAMYLERDGRGIRAYVWPVGSYFLAMNRRLEVDTAFHVVWYTLEQLIEEFGFNKISPQLQQEWKQKHYDKWVEVVHAVMPDRTYSDHVGRRLLPSGQYNSKYKSCWFELRAPRSHEGLLRESGMDRFPVIAARYDQLAERAYGTGPGCYVLPAAMALQEMHARLANLLDKSTKPPLTAPASMGMQSISQLAGDVTFRAEGSADDDVKPMYQIDPRSPNEAREAIAMYHAHLDQGFRTQTWETLVTIDQRLGPKNRTATEVQEIAAQNRLQMGPTLERMQSELLGPSVEWAYAELDEMGLLPALPSQLRNLDYQIEYISILAQAQKVATTQSLFQMVDFAGVVQEVTQEPVGKKLKGEHMLETFAESIGVPPEELREDEEFARIVDQQAQQLAASEEAIRAEQSAKAAAALGKTPMGGSTALEQLMQTAQSGGPFGAASPGPASPAIA